MYGLVVVSPFQTALLVYDTLLTFSLEVKYIWHEKLKLGSVLYIFARYPAVFTLLFPFPQFQTIKVSSHSTLNVNVQSSRKYLVRVTSLSRQCLMSKKVDVTTGPTLLIVLVFYRLSDYKVTTFSNLPIMDSCVYSSRASNGPSVCHFKPQENDCMGAWCLVY